MKGGERTGEAGVLHTHLYGDGYTLLVLQSEQSADAVAQGQSADVVEHHYEHHEKSAGEQFPGVVCNDDTNLWGWKGQLQEHSLQPIFKTMAGTVGMQG